MPTPKVTKTRQERMLELDELIQKARVQFRAIDAKVLRIIIENTYQLGFDHGMEVGYDGGFADGKGVRDELENETEVFEVIEDAT